MKKNQTLKRWVTLFFCFIVSNNFAQISTQNENPYSLGKNTEFLKQLELQLIQNTKKETLIRKRKNKINEANQVKLKINISMFFGNCYYHLLAQLNVLHYLSIHSSMFLTK